MALTIGSRIAHYDVTALIGEGGMGQVYRVSVDLLQFPVPGTGQRLLGLRIRQTTSGRWWRSSTVTCPAI